MSSPIAPAARVDVRPRVEYRQFQLVEEQRALDLPLTGGNDFHPSVRVETWHEEPPSDDASWDITESADITTASGVLRIRTWEDARVGPGLTLLPGPCHVRVHCRGRAEAAALVGQKLYYEGVEEWLLRVWPSPSGI